MALTFQKIFGTNSKFTTVGKEATFYVSDFANTDDTTNGAGDIIGLGISDFTNYTTEDIDQVAVNIFYSMILMIAQNQAENINADPTEKIFISEGGKNLGSGVRDGQLRRRINIDIFTDLNINELPDIDEL